MPTEILRVLAPGFSAAIQDRGRPGWRKFGVPPGGVMDQHGASWANRLLDNSPDAPVIELLLQGARFLVLADAWLAITGADAGCALPRWRAVRVRAGETIEFPANRAGVWNYLAVEGGFAGARILGSASANPRAGLGVLLRAGDVLAAANHRAFRLPEGVAGRATPMSEQRTYATPPRLRVWPGPQHGLFSVDDRERLFSQEWRVSSQSDRVGYRLEGRLLDSRVPQMVSEPVRVGTIQVPESGQPVVTMRDGPTVGGYPKLGFVEPDDLSWLVQCRPGQEVRFRPVGWQTDPVVSDSDV